MSNEEPTALAQPLTMEDVKDRIAARIKASFVELMPEEAWKTMVEREMNRFSETDRSPGWQQHGNSPLQRIVREILVERYRGMLNAELDKPEYSGHFGEPGEFITAFIKDNVPAIVTALLAGLGQGLVERVKQSIAQDAANRY